MPMYMKIGGQWNYILLSAFLTFLCWFYIASRAAHYRDEELLFKKYTYHMSDYLLQPSNTLCLEKPYHLIIIMMSHVGNVDLRNTHRRVMNTTYLSAMNATRIFLLAKIPEGETAVTQAVISGEHDMFGDILQGTFHDHYRNLTHKHLMGLKWASTACQNANFILKLDDDIVFNLERIYQLLSKVDISNRDLFLGKITPDIGPRRSEDSKWRVSWEEYRYTEYPPYLSGCFYITTPQVAGKLVDEAIYHEYFWIDDVYLGGLAQILDLKLTNVPKGFWMVYYEYVECCIKDMLNHFSCNYVVGPNGGKDNALEEFNEAIKKCSLSKQCTNSGNKSLCTHLRNTDTASDNSSAYL